MPAWTGQGDHETGLKLFDLATDLDHRSRVTLAVANSVARGERLAVHLGDQSLSPVHVVHGFLACGNNDAADWMCAASTTPAALIDVEVSTV